MTFTQEIEQHNKLIKDLKAENRLLGERCNQLLKDKGDLTDKIADIKANCDFAIEGRDLKIKELEEKNSQMFNTIALQEQQIEKMKCCENCKYKDCNKTSQYQTCWYCKNKDKWELKE